jgi:hypothetical protein
MIFSGRANQLKNVIDDRNLAVFIIKLNYHSNCNHKHQFNCSVKTLVIARCEDRRLTTDQRAQHRQAHVLADFNIFAHKKNTLPSSFVLTPQTQLTRQKKLSLPITQANPSRETSSNQPT